MTDIYSCTPINGTASSVTSQGGCTKIDELTPTQERENLVALVKRLQVRIQDLPKNSDARKELGRQIRDANQRISELKDKRYDRDISQYILDIVKETMPRPQWRRIVDEAVARMSQEAQ